MLTWIIWIAKINVNDIGGVVMAGFGDAERRILSYFKIGSKIIYKNTEYKIVVYLLSLELENEDIIEFQKIQHLNLKKMQVFIFLHI